MGKNSPIKLDSENIQIFKLKISKYTILSVPENLVYSIYSLNKMSLKRRINLRTKTLGFNFLGSSYKYGLFSYLGYLIDKTLIYLLNNIVDEYASK